MEKIPILSDSCALTWSVETDDNERIVSEKERAEGMGSLKVVVHRTKLNDSEGRPLGGRYPKHLESSIDEQAVKGNALSHTAS